MDPDRRNPANGADGTVAARRRQLDMETETLRRLLLEFESLVAAGDKRRSIGSEIETIRLRLELLDDERKWLRQPPGAEASRGAAKARTMHHLALLVRSLEEWLEESRRGRRRRRTDETILESLITGARRIAAEAARLADGPWAESGALAGKRKTR